MSEQNLTPAGQIVKGYKATDADMCCREFKFEIGKWYEHDGDLKLCESGFHFCEYPSGPWYYYTNDGTRIFKCEAELVLFSKEPGADLKHVAKKIRLVEEIKIVGDGNTGCRNTGCRNTGDRNTGNLNTGDRNTGNLNTGYRNTGDRNTGDRNTGNWNTGDRNTGNWNTGDGNTGNMNTGNMNTGNRNTGNRNTGNGNTGNRNTGNWNTGDWNTGDRNTGDGNAGNFNSGFFNIGNAPFIVFGKKADRKNFDYSLARKLSEKLSSDLNFDPTPFLEIPGATKNKIKKLHAEHIRLRKEKKI
jgi:hypothetical protein